MSGPRPERIDRDCPILSVTTCAQQKVRLGIIGDMCEGGYEHGDGVESMLRLTLAIEDPDDTACPGELWLDRDDAIHLADVLRMFALTLERTQLQCEVWEARRPPDPDSEAEKAIEGGVHAPQR